MPPRASRRCCRSTATTRASPTTARRRCTRPMRFARTSRCSTSACRGSTATRSRAGFAPRRGAKRCSWSRSPAGDRPRTSCARRRPASTILPPSPSTSMFSVRSSRMRAGASANAAAAGRVTTPSPALVGGYVLAYVALDWISFIDPIGAFAITPWNPPPGLSLAFLLRYGLRQGAWLFVAALAAEFLVRGAPAPLPLLVAASLLLALSYTAVAAILTRVLRMSPDLATLRDAAIFVVTAAIACGVIALAFVALFAGSGLLPPGEFWRGVAQFWIGDLIGIVVTAPALLVLTRTRNRPSLRPGPEALVELAVITVALWIVFGTGLGDAPKLFYVLFLPVIWIAMRHGLEGAVLGTVAIQVGLIAAIVASRQNPGTVFEFQFVMLALAATALLLGAAVSERK